MSPSLSDLLQSKVSRTSNQKEARDDVEVVRVGVQLDSKSERSKELDLFIVTLKKAIG